MFCSNCGKEIPEGQTSCPDCGTPIPSAAAPKAATPNVSFDSIKAGIGAGAEKIKGSVDSMGMDSMKIVSLAGAALVTISPLFHWISAKMSYGGMKEKESASLFGMETGILTFSAIMILLAGLLLLAWEVADYIPAIASFKESIKNMNGVSAIYEYIPLILVGVAFLFFLIAYFNGDYRDGIKAAKEAFKVAKAFGAKGHVNRGLGPIVAFLGIITSAFPKVIAIIKK